MKKKLNFKSGNKNKNGLIILRTLFLLISNQEVTFYFNSIKSFYEGSSSNKFIKLLDWPTHMACKITGTEERKNMFCHTNINQQKWCVPPTLSVLWKRHQKKVGKKDHLVKCMTTNVQEGIIRNARIVEDTALLARI